MDLLEQLAAHPALKNFRLVGGTGLALQIGHRLSVDLDFFSDQKNDLSQIENELLLLEGMQLKANSSHALFLEFKGVKVDVLNYPYAFIASPIIYKNVVLSHTDDIAAMKLKTIQNRGAKKDFYDIWFLLEQYSIHQIIELFVKKYNNIEPAAVYKSLTYFEDADIDEDPVLLRNKSLTWTGIKKRLIEETRKLL